MDFSQVKVGDRIEYVGDSWAFGGAYTTVSAESTYTNPENCPEHEKGKLMIIEFMNNGNPMFFTLDRLESSEWEQVSEVQYEKL